MADGQSRNFTPRDTVPYALTDYKYRIVSQERLEGGTRPPTIGFRIRRDGVAIVGYTNVQGDEFDGKIEAMLDPADAMYLPQMLERAVRLQAGTHEGLAIAARRYDQENRKWSDPRPSATFRVGRDDDGVIYLSMASWKRTRPIIKIALIPSELLRHLDGSDQPLTPSQASERTALTWASSLRAMLPLALTMNYVPPKPRGESQGGNRGGYNGGQRAGGYEQRRESTPAPAPSPAPSSGPGGYEYDDLPM